MNNHDDAMRVTKQGVRDLNPRGHKGHQNHGAVCKHWWSSYDDRGLPVVIGQQWEIDDFGQEYLVDVPGQRCVWCRKERATR